MSNSELKNRNPSVTAGGVHVEGKGPIKGTPPGGVTSWEKVPLNVEMMTLPPENAAPMFPPKLGR